MNGTGSPGLRVWVVVAAATLALGPLTSPASVLCRGEDGHVGIEAAFAPCCSVQEPSDTGHPTDARSQHPCDGCTDVSVDQAAAPVTRGHAAPPPAAADRLTQPPPAPPLSRWVALPEPGTPARGHDLAVVRATVLLR